MNLASLEQQLLEIQRKLQSKINSALKNEVSTTSRETLKKHIQTDVYDQYTSQAAEPYIRRYDQGGLLDDENIETVMIDDNTLMIENTTTNDKFRKYIPEIIESGTGYTWINSEIYRNQPYPRPFVERTFEELASGVAREALKKGLIRQGVNIK